MDQDWTSHGSCHHDSGNEGTVPGIHETFVERGQAGPEGKQGQRASKQEDESKMQPVSLDQLYESTEYEVSDGVDLEANLIKLEMIAELHAALDELEEMDRTIMKMFGDGATEKQIAEVVHLSQKGVNKRKKKVMVQLKTRLKAFE